MDAVDKDLRDFLEYYVRRKSDKEKKLIKAQKLCQLQLCITVNHSNCPETNKGKDLLMIHTKLIQLNHEKDDQLFYIKSQNVSHCTGLTGHNNDTDHKVMSIITIITMDNSKCETVFMTFVTKAENGKRLTLHRSFTREIVDCEHWDSALHRHCKFEAVFSDNEKSLEEIKEKKSSRDKDSKKSTMSILLPKLWKRKSPKKMSKSKLSTGIKPVLSNKKMSLACMSDFSAEFKPTVIEKPRNILAKISVSHKTQSFEVIEDDVPFMDEENENDIYNEFVSDLPKETPNSDSYIQFNLSTCNESKSETVDLFKDATCNCTVRRLSSITRYIEWKLDKRSQFEDISNTFNWETGHFPDCHNLSPGIQSSNSNDSLSSSRNSVFLDKSFNGNNQFLTPEFSLEKSRKNSIIESAENLDKILDNVKNEIQCSVKHINYFKSLTEYKEFEKQLLILIGTDVSVKHLSLFLFMIRSIVQHIDDPSSKDNQIILKIMNFSTQFLLNIYGKSIKDQGGIILNNLVMVDIKTDLASLLFIYIKQESEEEQRFIEDQENCELKLCLSVSHSNCGWNNRGADLLMIHTRLNQSNELIEQNIDQIPNQFYIKSQIVSHCTGLLTTDVRGANKIMSIETIVTKNNYNCETVFKTFVTKAHDDKKIKTQRSFTREISHYLDPKSKLRNRFTVVFSGDERDNEEPSVPHPPTKIKIKKKRFTFPKKSKSNDKQGLPDHKSGTHSGEELKVLQPIKKHKSNFLKNLRNFFLKSRTVSIEDKTSPISSTVRSVGNPSEPLMPEVTTFSTDSNEMEKEKPTNILAKISLKNGKKIFEIIDDNIPFFDEFEDEESEEEECISNSKSNSDCGSLLHFDFTVSSEIHHTINGIIQRMKCDCSEKKYTMISDILLNMAKKNKELNNKIRSDFEKFDKVKQHFFDCAVWICNKKNTIYQRKRRQSNQDNQDLCQICHDIDEHFKENFCTIFVPFLKEIEKKERNEMCLCERKKKEKIKSIIYSTVTSIKINDEFRGSFNKVTNHFMNCINNEIPPAVNHSTIATNNNFDEKIETISCNCYKRRMQILSNFISHIFFKKCLMNGGANEFGLARKHSTSCPRNSPTSVTSPLSFTPSPFNDGSPVFDSFPQVNPPAYGNEDTPESTRKRFKNDSCSSVHSIKSVNDMIQYLKNGYEIECPIETIEYFIKCKDFDSFEKGIFKVFDQNISIENMCLFFYVIRKIVRYIDDPKYNDNEDIKRIIEYSETFLFKYYVDAIIKQEGLKALLKHLFYDIFRQFSCHDQEKFIMGIDSLD